MKTELAAAIASREAGRDEEARAKLLSLHRAFPDDPVVNLQCAWVHDKLGMEADAVPFYETAIAGGLDSEDLRDALLGLGSTYRALGRYAEALATLERGTETYPDDNGMKVFAAMALYNNGRSKEACELLMTLLAETSQDESVRRYQPALTEYANDLDRTWA